MGTPRSRWRHYSVEGEEILNSRPEDLKGSLNLNFGETTEESGFEVLKPRPKNPWLTSKESRWINLALSLGILVLLILLAWR